MTWIKICGTTTRDDALAAVEAGADAVGFVFAPSPRRIAPEAAQEIAASLAAPRSTKWASSANESAERIERSRAPGGAHHHPTPRRRKPGVRAPAVSRHRRTRRPPRLQGGLGDAGRGRRAARVRRRRCGGRHPARLRRAPRRLHGTGHGTGARRNRRQPSIGSAPPILFPASRSARASFSPAACRPRTSPKPCASSSPGAWTSVPASKLRPAPRITIRFALLLAAVRSSVRGPH